MIPELISMLFETKLISKEQYESMQPLKKPYGERLGSFLVNHEVITKKSLEKFLEENKNTLFELFDQWQVDNSKISNAIIWRDKISKKDSNNGYSYLSWPKSKKNEISNIFWETLLNVQPNLPETPPSTVKLKENGEAFSVDLKPENAWNYYLAYVSQCLAVELDRLVHWSIFKYNKTQLELLLDSSSLFEYSESQDVYSILKKHETLFNHGEATLGDPTRIYDFLDKEKLIGITRIDSIGHLLGWCRENMYKITEGNTFQNYKDYWQYEGYPPVERIILGTNHPQKGFQHFTAGCWVTSGFLRTVLRTINIPVVLEERCGHALPCFMYNTHKFYLSHGDDPYNKLYKITSLQFPPIDLLINHYKFDELFDENLPEGTLCNNIGIHVFDLALEYLPDEIIKIYCDDVANGKTEENGRVFNEIFKNHISLNELKKYSLWDRLKKRVEEFGGCSSITTK